MDVPEPVKKYWPYAVGGIVGIFILVKMSGGSSSGGAMSVSPGVDPSVALAQKNLDIAAAQAAQQGNINAMLAQGQVAGQVGAAATGLVNALNAPTVQAINAAAAENIGTTQSAVAAAMAGYDAQVKATQSAAVGAAGIAQGFSNAANSVTAAVNAATQSIGFQPYRAQMQTTGDSYGQTVSAVGTLALAAVSDENVKTDIVPTDEDSLSLISQVEFVAFKYIDPKYGDEHPVGAVAQRLREINPAWVGETEDGLLFIKIPQFMMSIAHAMKQLNAKIEGVRNGTV